jgi:hypothetical protein
MNQLALHSLFVLYMRACCATGFDNHAGWRGPHQHGCARQQFMSVSWVVQCPVTSHQDLQSIVLMQDTQAQAHVPFYFSSVSTLLENGDRIVRTSLRFLCRSIDADWKANPEHSESGHFVSALRCISCFHLSIRLLPWSRDPQLPLVKLGSSNVELVTDCQLSHNLVNTRNVRLHVQTN